MLNSPVRADARDIHANPDAGTGVLLCHGFTGSPRSMRPWAEDLAAAGHRVEVPRLPGHGTHWREMDLTDWTDWYECVERVWRRLARECDQVFVGGLSMGGALACRLAEEHPVDGLMLVNPAIGSDSPRFRLLGVARHVIRSLPSIGDDIALPEVVEGAYERTPLRPAHSMTQLWHLVQQDLDRIDCDVLLMTSKQDHVVDKASARLLSEALAGRVERLELARSFHVATLDHDAPLVFEASRRFISAHGTSAEEPRR